MLQKCENMLWSHVCPSSWFAVSRLAVHHMLGNLIYPLYQGYLSMGLLLVLAHVTRKHAHIAWLSFQYGPYASKYVRACRRGQCKVPIAVSAQPDETL